MASNQQFCLRWNNHQSTLISVFDTLLESGTLVDCTLAAEGQSLKAHKVVLSACSPYLESLLSQHYEKHPILILKDVTFAELKAMLDYMYRGEVNICQDQLGTFLKAAESLQIKGLTDNSSGDLPGRKLDLPRKLVNPYSVPKSPLFPQGLIVEPRPAKLNSNNNNNSNTNNNNSSECGTVKSGSDGGLSPKRRKQRRSCEDLPRESSDVLYPSPILSEPSNTAECLVKTEPKYSDEVNVNNDNSGDELPCDADDEEELDLSRPGTSQGAHNSLQPGWNASADNTAEEMFPPGQHEQGLSRKFVSPMRLIPWELWASMQPAVMKGQANSQGGVFGGSDGVECLQCGRHYKLKSSLRNHQKWECGKEPQFQCPYCNYRAKQKMHVVRHIERMHREKLDMLDQEATQPQVVKEEPRTPVEPRAGQVVP